MQEFTPDNGWEEKNRHLNQSEIDSDELALTECGKEKNPPTKHIGPYTRDVFLLHCCVDGKGYYVCEGKEYKIARGDIFLIRPGEQIEYWTDHERPWTYLWAGFRGSRASRLIGQTAFSFGPVARFSHECAEYFYKLIDEYNEHGVLNITCLGYLYLILGSLRAEVAENDNSGSRDRYVREAVKFIMYNMENDISVQSIADSLQITPNYFINVFTSVMGVSPMQYLASCRLERAYAMLRDGVPVSEAMTANGYHSRDVFTKVFKRRYGVLPRHVGHRTAQKG